MKRVATLDLNEDATVNDIETLIDHGLESAIGVECRSNEDGTYAVYIGS